MRFDSLAASFPATHYQRVHQTKVEYEFQSIVSSYLSQWGILFGLESFRDNFELQFNLRISFKKTYNPDTPWN